MSLFVCGRMEILKKQLPLFFTPKDIKLVQVVNGKLLLFPESLLIRAGLPNEKKGGGRILHLFSWNFFEVDSKVSLRSPVWISIWLRVQYNSLYLYVIFAMQLSLILSVRWQY